MFQSLPIPLFFIIGNGCHRNATSNWQAKGSSSFGCVFQLLCHWLLTLLTIYIPSRMHNQLRNFFVWCHLKFACYKWDLFACGFCAPEWFGHCSLQTAKVIWATWLWADWCCALGVGWTQLATAITEVKSTEHISSIESKMDVRQF